MSNSPYRASPTRGLSNDSLSRTNSLPLGMNTIDGPVQIRLPNPRAHKKAQHWRTSVASTNSDYYNQWRPQLSPLVRVHSIGSGINLPGQSAASLDTISEYEMREFGGDDIDQEYKSPLVRPHVSQRNSINADPSMFRYTPTPILDPQRQTVPTPLSRPTTPQIGSGGYAQPTPSIYLNSPPENGYNNKVANSNFLKASSQAIHVSAAANNQFLPLFLNPETGNVYMFEDGFYIPIPSKNVQELEKATNINSNVLTKAPTPDRRSITLPDSPPDHRLLVVVLMILSFVFLSLPVLLLFLLPSLACSLKVRRHNSLGNADKAKSCSEWVLCSSVSALIFLIPTSLIIPITILVLAFAVDVI